MAFKFLVPASILVIIFLLSWYLTTKFTLDLDFSQGFNVNIRPAPQSADGGISIVLNGVAGDKAVVGFTFPNSTSSEELIVTQKNLDEIKSSLNQFEAEQWEFLTHLPSSVFRFDVILFSYLDSPNNAKKTSYYLITPSQGVVHKLSPGQKMILAHNFKVDDLPSMLSKVQIKLIYENGLYQNFYNKKGELVSQATGQLIIKPTLRTQLLIIFGVWAFVIAFSVLIKQTIMSSQDVKEVWRFFTDNK